MLEVVEISEGLPQSRLTEVAPMPSPHCGAVPARAVSESVDVRSWRGCGLSGVTLDGGHLDPADRTAQLRLGGFEGRAAEVALSCVSHEFPSHSLMLAAWASGFTHVGGPLLSAELGPPESVLHLRPSDLFSNTASGPNESSP
jgi:hypothetical protein